MSAIDRLIRWAIAIATGLAGIPNAHAQLAGRVSIDSEYRLRGYSIAEAKPVATASVNYDDASGLYFNGLVVAGAENADVDVAGVQGAVGYAVRADDALSIDVGLMQTQYARRVGGSLNLRYTEVYAGLSRHHLMARVYYSPNYFGSNRHTLYGEIEGNVQPLTDWNLNLHLGALAYLNRLPTDTARARYDWRTTVSRRIGSFELYASLSGRGPGGDRYARTKGRAVATAGAAITF